MSQRDLAIFTDLYQLTMLQAYHKEGMEDTAVFSLFVRRIPERKYMVACGLESALEYLEELSFSDKEIAYLEQQGQFEDDFLDYLRDFRFTGNVYAVREGTLVFPDEPILEVEAPIGQAQLAETFLLNQVTFQTAIASKASRIAEAAESAVVADFAMRRMHGIDAALKGARAAYIAGVDSTSNVKAGEMYGIPITGTMAHSYIEAHDSEEDAFRAFSSLYPDTTLLVDTYDTLEGVQRVINLSEELGDAFTVGAIRLDSGDLEELAFSVRSMLDDAGLQDIEIFASGGLDEYRIAEMLENGAPIDGFGVGTKLGTVADRPYLDSAYKLCAYAGEPRMKLSPNKANLPGRKQLYRREKEGKYTEDIIATDSEEILDAEPLLRRVMNDGERTDVGKETLEDLRKHAARSIDRLPSYLSFHSTESQEYPVHLSDELQKKRDRTREQLQTSPS